MTSRTHKPTHTIEIIEHVHKPRASERAAFTFVQFVSDRPIERTQIAQRFASQPNQKPSACAHSTFQNKPKRARHTSETRRTARDTNYKIVKVLTSLRNSRELQILPPHGNTTNRLSLLARLDRIRLVPKLCVRSSGTSVSV